VGVVRFQGAAPLGGNFGDGMGISRLRKIARAGMNNNASSAIPPRPIKIGGNALPKRLAP
jgi:hypothetical protein